MPVVDAAPGIFTLLGTNQAAVLNQDGSVNDAGAAAARGDHGTATDYLRRAVGVDPYREDLQRTLMQTLADGGNPSGALLVRVLLRLCARENSRRAAAARGTGVGTPLGSKEAGRWTARCVS